MITLDTPCLTRKRLMELSGSPAFRLPAAAKNRQRTIAPLTYEQVRYFERHGCFDWYRVEHRMRDQQAQIIWKPRQLGATALYTLLDVAVARLCAWMLQEDVPHRVIVEMLRGLPSGRVTLPAADRVLVAHNETAWVLSESRELYAMIVGLYSQQGRALTADNTKVYPVAWLGITRKFISGIQKEFEIPTVPLWNRMLTPAEALHVQQEQQAR